MDMKFENSPEYKLAQENYKKRVFSDLLRPELVLPKAGYSIFDTLYLFYNKNSINEIFSLFEKEWKSITEDENDEYRPMLPIHIGHQKPMLKEKYIFGEKRKCVMLWYDGEQELMIEQIRKFII
jgi:hypothetical protein